MKKNLTLKDIAALANVGKSTASEIINNKPGLRVSDATRQRVLDIVREYNYTPSAFARALSTKSTRHIGFLLSSKTTMSLANEHYAMILNGVQQTCLSRGFYCTVTAYDMSNLADFMVPDNIQQKSVDGVIITGIIESDVIEILKSYNIPMVLVGSVKEVFEEETLICVRRDTDAEFMNILNYFHSLGHRLVGITNYSKKITQARSWCLEQFNRNHLDDQITLSELEDLSQTCDAFEIGHSHAVEWMQQPKENRPTAFYSDNHWCQGFLSTIQRAGMRCPAEVSVLSGDDSANSKWFFPRITSIQTSASCLGSTAASILVDLLEHKTDKTDAKRIANTLYRPGDLVLGDSTGPVPL